MGALRVSPSRTTDPETLIRAIGTERAPILVDVRRRGAFDAAETVLPGALWRDHREAPAWGPALQAAAGGREIVVYCVHGEQVSQAAASLLRQAGIRARALAGGFDGYAAAGGPLVARTDNDRPTPSRWVTRARPTVDGIACSWFVRRFVDPLAEIHVAEPAWVTAVAVEIGGAAFFDAEGAGIAREGERCSFDAMLARYQIDDSALLRLAEIVRGAATARLDRAPEAAGLLAATLGLDAAGLDDQAVLARGLTLYDALYDWARFAAEGTPGKPTAGRVEGRS